MNESDYLEALLGYSSQIEELHDPSVKELILIYPVLHLVKSVGIMRKTNSSDVNKSTIMAIQILINLSASEACRRELHEQLHQAPPTSNNSSSSITNLKTQLLSTLAKDILQGGRNEEMREHAAAVLSNLCTDEKLWRGPVVEQVTLDDLVKLCLDLPRSQEERFLQLLLNMTSDASVRSALCSKEKHPDLMLSLLPLMDPNDQENSTACRNAVIGIVKNCAFDDDNHEFLISHARVTLSILRSLCGPKDEITREERPLLPVEIRDIPGAAATVREPETELLVQLLEALLQLCSQPLGRHHLWYCGAYLLLREVARQVKDNRAVQLAVENVYPMIAGQEPEQSHIRAVEVPPELQAEIERVKENFLAVD